MAPRTAGDKAQVNSATARAHTLQSRARLPYTVDWRSPKSRLASPTRVDSRRVARRTVGALTTMANLVTVLLRHSQSRWPCPGGERSQISQRVTPIRVGWSPVARRTAGGTTQVASLVMAQPPTARLPRWCWVGWPSLASWRVTPTHAGWFRAARPTAGGAPATVVFSVTGLRPSKCLRWQSLGDGRSLPLWQVITTPAVWQQVAPATAGGIILTANLAMAPTRPELPLA